MWNASCRSPKGLGLPARLSSASMSSSRVEMGEGCLSTCPRWEWASSLLETNSRAFARTARTFSSCHKRPGSSPRALPPSQALLALQTQGGYTVCKLGAPMGTLGHDAR